jgi:WD40 repeat protein
MYDLRAHSKWRILEGHAGPISAVCFDKKGRKVASYSKEDNTIRVWKV